MAKPTLLEVLLKDQRLLGTRAKLGDWSILRGKAGGIHPWQKFVLPAPVTRKQSRYLHISLDKVDYLGVIAFGMTRRRAEFFSSTSTASRTVGAG